MAMAKRSKQLAVAIACLMAMVVRGHAAGPIAMFVFGDSLVDTGNNDYIASTARANFRPNGLDYPTGKPTGRFCNGKIISDFISDYMGTPPIKPYLDPTNDDSSLLLGSNFASAGAGILNTTGRLLVTVDKQYALFEEYKQKVAAIIGQAAMEKMNAQKSVVCPGYCLSLECTQGQLFSADAHCKARASPSLSQAHTLSLRQQQVYSSKQHVLQTTRNGHWEVHRNSQP